MAPCSQEKAQNYSEKSGDSNMPGKGASLSTIVMTIVTQKQSKWPHMISKSISIQNHQKGIQSHKTSAPPQKTRGLRCGWHR